VFGTFLINLNQIPKQHKNTKTQHSPGVAFSCLIVSSFLDTIVRTRQLPESIRNSVIKKYDPKGCEKLAKDLEICVIQQVFRNVRNSHVTVKMLLVCCTII